MPPLVKLLLVAVLIAIAAPALSAERLLAARVWPAQDTRASPSRRAAGQAPVLLRDRSDRLVIDLEGIEVTDELRALPAKVGENDPYIRAMRVGANRPNVVRVVLDLRTEVKPSVFPLAPVGEYKHRLVLDLVPDQARRSAARARGSAPDPIAEIGAASVTAPADLPVVRLVPPKEPGKPAQPVLAAARGPAGEGPPRDRGDRRGHGGEDPGARGATARARRT
jgi:N-acetylmuramoyl-L-alanine amidase